MGNERVHLNIQTCKFVDSSEVFEGELSSVRDVLFENGSFSWGDNNRSLVSKIRLLEAMSLIDAEEDDTFDDFLFCTEETLDRAKRRVEALPDDVYIDLES